MSKKEKVNKKPAEKKDLKKIRGGTYTAPTSSTWSSGTTKSTPTGPTGY